LPVILHSQPIPADFGQGGVQVVDGHQGRVVRAAQPGMALIHKNSPVARSSTVEGQCQQVVAPSVDSNDQIAVSAITFIEIVYLIDKGRIQTITLDRLGNALSKSDALVVAIPVDWQTSRTMASVSRDAIPDMPDRIIAATALHLGVPLISRDRRIQLSAVETVW